jgi:uncharacterized protein YbjT (DUF2867 family)
VSRRVVVAGAHGQVGRRLVRRLAAHGDEVVGLVRNPDHLADVEADGGRGVHCDLEAAPLEEVTWALQGADATVFAAGAGPGSGAPRKDTMDRGGAVLLAAAAERAGVRRYLLLSSMGVESVRDGSVPEGVDDVFLAYLRAKLAAEEDVRARDLDSTVLRPGRLTDDPGTGRVALGPEVPRGDVPRDDVAAVLAELLGEPATAGRVLELASGEEPVHDAVRRQAAR